MDENFVIIIVTCCSKKEAQKIAACILKKKLAACANIISGVCSKFWWNGRIDSAKETILMIKTLRSRFKKIEVAVKSLHSYEVPEIIAIPILSGSRDYLNWIDESIKA